MRDRSQGCGALTQEHSGDAPAQGVVEAHGATVHVAWLHLHTVEVQAVHEEPSEGAEEEVVQEDGDRCAHQLKAGGGGRQHRFPLTPHLGPLNHGTLPRRPALTLGTPTGASLTSDPELWLQDFLGWVVA